MMGVSFSSISHAISFEPSLRLWMVCFVYRYLSTENQMQVGCTGTEIRSITSSLAE